MPTIDVHPLDRDITGNPPDDVLRQYATRYVTLSVERVRTPVD
jgi:hypothetical protein